MVVAVAVAVAVYDMTPLRSGVRRNTLQHTTTPCNTLQHAPGGTHRNVLNSHILKTLQRTAILKSLQRSAILQSLQYTAAH